MSEEATREIIVEAVLGDSYDGAVRLLGDAQRFGFKLKSLALADHSEGSASATLVLRVPVSVDAQLVAARLGRHPTVQRVEARVTPTALLVLPEGMVA